MSTQSTMTLNHLSFPTRDVAAEVAFFKQYLCATVAFIDARSGTALLRHGAVDIVLEAMNEDVSWHPDFHFGFECPTKQAVEALYDEFKRAGIRLDSEVFNRVGRGSRFFGRTPGGVSFEVNTREDMLERWKAA